MTSVAALPRPRRSTSVQMGIVAILDCLAVNRDLVRQVKSEAESQPFLVILERERIELENALVALQVLRDSQVVKAA